MAANDSGEQQLSTRKTVGHWAKQAGLAVLFWTILLIPRIRRLRRRVWAWTAVRLGMALCGAWLVWRTAQGSGGALAVTAGLFLLAFSLFVRAKPQAKSLDGLAQELGALVVLNGGAFRLLPDSTPINSARIFVHPERVIIMDSRERRLAAIPFAKVQSLTAHPDHQRADESEKPWEVEISWLADSPCITTLRYTGAFAEHLARVAESTLRGQWIKELPVIHP